MILVDTSVWIDHFRQAEHRLIDPLGEGRIAIHPFVIGELACGNLAQRKQVLSDLSALPHSPELSHEEVLHFIARWRLSGLGLGLIDIHLLASARLAGVSLWTRDCRLQQAAQACQLPQADY